MFNVPLYLMITEDDDGDTEEDNADDCDGEHQHFSGQGLSEREHWSTLETAWMRGVLARRRSLVVSHLLFCLFCSPSFVHDDVLICVATQVVPMVQGNCCHVEDPKTLNDVETK